MGSRRYSDRLGVLSDEQLQAALDRFGLGKLLAAEPIANGLFGQNIMLRAEMGEYIFRGAPHWNPAGEDDWQFQKERFFSRLVHESGTGPPVAWPYMLEEGRDIFGWGFAIQPRLPGGPLVQPMRGAYANTEMRQMSGELGRALAGLHTVEVAAAGTHDAKADAIQPLATSYADYVEAVIDDLLGKAVTASDATSPDDVAWARSIVAESRAAMEMPFTPTVVHLDFGFHNVLFEQDEAGWRLTGVIDWMTAEAGHPECDLARPLATARQYRIPGVSEFLGAYRRDRPELPGFRERFPVFMLWERLLIWSYWQAHGGFRDGVGMRAWMEPYAWMLDDEAMS